MIRTVCRLVAMAFVLVAIAAAPARVWAAAFWADDDPDAAPALMVVEDFNRDGIADIAEATLPAGVPSGLHLLKISLGQRDGTFKQVGSSPALGYGPKSMIVGDFNGDGIPDVIVGDEDGSLIELLGDGTGNLVSAGEVGRVGSVVSIAENDFNHDGIPDMAVLDTRDRLVTVLLGTGKGSFKAAWAFALPLQGAVFHIAAADFNGDGLPDLAITNVENGTFQVMLSNGNGTFTYAPQLSNVKDPNSHCVT